MFKILSRGIVWTTVPSFNLEPPFSQPLAQLFSCEILCLKLIVEISMQLFLPVISWQYCGKSSNNSEMFWMYWIHTGSRSDPEFQSGMWNTQAVMNNLWTLYMNICSIFSMLIVRNVHCFCFNVIFNFLEFNMSILSYFV